MSSISQKIARPARTAGQGSLAYAVVETIDAFGADFTTRQYGALVLLGTLIFGFLQVVIEDRLGVALLRKIPSPDVHPVETEERGAGSDYQRTRDNAHDGLPEQTDNRPRPEDGEQLPFEESGDAVEWTGGEMR